MKSTIRNVALAGLLALPLPALAQNASSRTIKPSVGYSYTSTRVRDRHTETHRIPLSFEYELEPGIAMGIRGDISMVERNTRYDGRQENFDYVDVAPFFNFTVETSKFRIDSSTIVHTADPIVLEVLGQRHYSLVSRLEVQLLANKEHDGPFLRGEYHQANIFDEGGMSIGFRFSLYSAIIALSLTPYQTERAYDTRMTYGSVEVEYPRFFGLFDISATLSGTERARLFLKARAHLTAASSLELQLDVFRDYSFYHQQTVMRSTSGSAIFAVELP